MRMIFSIVGFLLFVVGCQALTPVKDRVIELPTLKYQEQAHVHNEGTVRRSVRGADTGKEALRAIVESCRKYGKFTVKDDSTYICYPEK